MICNASIELVFTAELIWSNVLKSKNIADLSQSRVIFPEKNLVS